MCMTNQEMWSKKIIRYHHTQGNLIKTLIFVRQCFSAFATAEPLENACVVHGTLCNDPSVYIAVTAWNCGCEFRPRQFRSVSAEALVATRRNIRFGGTMVEKHCYMQLKI